MALSGPAGARPDLGKGSGSSQGTRQQEFAPDGYVNLPHMSRVSGTVSEVLT